MITFKEALKRDRVNVFLNSAEFADTHEINGQTVLCNVQSVETAEYSTARTNTIEGVYLNALTVYVSAEDLERKPVENELISVDGKRLFVRSVTEELNGMLVILCEANDQ